MSEASLLPLGAAFLLGALLAALGVYLWQQRRLQSQAGELTRLQAQLEAEQRIAQQRRIDQEQSQQALSERFSALSQEALKHNTESFLRLAGENIQKHLLQSESNLQQREKAIENLVKPLQEALKRSEAQVRQMEKERQEAYGSLNRHLETLTQSQLQLQSETRNLVQALRRPEVRGRWGEMTLKRLAELAGMVEYCDFFEQETVGEGTLRPDMVIRLPDQREIVVDAKTPLDAYLNAIEAQDDQLRDQQLLRHARTVRERVRELSAKAYWNQFKHAPDFVVLFIPGDQFLSAALDHDHSLLEEAMQQKVILATPTSLVALLRAVAYGWRQLAVAENAERIRDLGDELYKRLATFGDHLSKLGKSLGSSVEHYNKAVGSLERQVLPGARRFTEMGIREGKKLPELDPLDKSVRDVGSD